MSYWIYFCQQTHIIRIIIFIIIIYYFAMSVRVGTNDVLIPMTMLSMYLSFERKCKIFQSRMLIEARRHSSTELHKLLIYAYCWSWMNGFNGGYTIIFILSYAPWPCLFTQASLTLIGLHVLTNSETNMFYVHITYPYLYLEETISH